MEKLTEKHFIDLGFEFERESFTKVLTFWEFHINPKTGNEKLPTFHVSYVIGTSSNNIGKLCLYLYDEDKKVRHFQVRNMVINTPNELKWVIGMVLHELVEYYPFNLSFNSVMNNLTLVSKECLADSNCSH